MGKGGRVMVGERGEWLKVGKRWKGFGSLMEPRPFCKFI
jgi:hypothetical protein